jgi:short-subunit dehydrogenase
MQYPMTGLRTVLITGASYGLGAEIAVGLAKAIVGISHDQPTFVLTARSQEGLDSTAERVRSVGAIAETVIADLASSASVADFSVRIRDRNSPVDCFVSCAALSPFVLFEEQDSSQLTDLLHVNLVAPLAISRALLPGMVERRSGNIVVISSMAGKYGLPFNAAYSASKGGLIQWTQAMRGELRGTGVEARVICPMSVSRVGVSARGGQTNPWILGQVSPERVVSSVVDAVLRKGSFERIVSSRPVRPLLVLGQIFPGVGPKLVRMLGVTKMYSAITTSRRTIQ